MTVDAPAVEVRRALDALPATQHSSRAALLNELGERLRRDGDTLGARQAFLDAARHARSVGDAELLGAAALGYGLGAGGLHRGLRCDLQHIALLEEALSTLGPVEGGLRVRLLARLAEELYFTPETTVRAALCSEAVAMARRIDDAQVLLPALHARALGHVGPDFPLDERISEATELVELAAQLGEWEACYLGHMLRELALIEAGRHQEALQDLDAAEQIADELGISSLRAWASTARARRLWLAGRFADAEAENAKGLQQALDNGGDPEAANLVVGGQLLSFQLLRHDLAPFLPALQQYRAEYPHFTVLRCFWAYACCETGHAEAASQELGELGQLGFADLARNAEWPGSMWALTRTAALLGDTTAAASLYAELAFCSGRWLADWASTCMGPVDTCLGTLAAMTRADDVAETHFGEAEALARGAGSPAWLADAQVQHATALLRRGGAARRERAEALLGEALSSCEAFGIEALAVRARTLLS